MVCGVEIPGIRSLAAVCLMTDGTWTTDPTLHPDDRATAQRWITSTAEAVILRLTRFMWPHVGPR